MAERTIDEQLVKYLTDAHSIEEQALQQLRMAPDAAGDEHLAALLREHLAETETHERLVREQLATHGASPSALKGAVMRAGGAAFVLFARSQPDTPGKLAAHAYSYEHLELAAYELLLRVADRAGDRLTAATARRIREEERRMGERLEAAFDSTVDASLRDLDPENLDDQLAKYLADAHAIEAQAIAGDPALARIYAEHLDETRAQQELVRERLEAHDTSPSRLKDAALRLGALNWGGFFAAQPDTPGKLAAFAYAFEHLEIGGYEELKRVAERAGDGDTVTATERILAEERAAAGKIAGSFDLAVSASLRAQEVGV